jgi:hypothetical protein
MPVAAHPRNGEFLRSSREVAHNASGPVLAVTTFGGRCRKLPWPFGIARTGCLGAAVPAMRALEVIAVD